MTKPVKIIIIVAVVLSAGLTCLLILATLAIPAMQAVNRQAHQTSAIASLRMLNQMEAEYNSTYPDHGFACSLAALGGNEGSGAPTADDAQLISSDLASGTKSGYVFTFSGCTKTKVHNKEIVTGYQITAVPTVLNRTGNLGYCTNENAEIRYDPKGGTNCTELLQ